MRIKSALGLLLLFSTFSVLAAVPSAPKLIKPTNNATLTSGDPPKFSWMKSAGASKYQIIFSKDASFSGFSNNTCNKTCVLATTTKTEYILTDIKQGKAYWAVRAVNASGNSRWSTAWSFTK